MSVLVIAPYRPDLPNVATEAAAVINALGGRLVQGRVTETDVRDAVTETQYDGIWFATHATIDRVWLSEEALTEAALIAYVAASGARWCFLNTCESLDMAGRILDETPADVICVQRSVPDPDAMRTGVLFARNLALVGDTRTAYERSKPGGNRAYRYLENFRQREMVVQSSSGASTPMQDRLQTTMDEMRRDMGKMASDVEVLKTRTGSIETRNEKIESRLADIEKLLRPAPTWQTWAMLLLGLLACIGVVVLLLQAGT